MEKAVALTPENKQQNANKLLGIGKFAAGNVFAGNIDYKNKTNNVYNEETFYFFVLVGYDGSIWSFGAVPAQC